MKTIQSSNQQENFRYFIGSVLLILICLSALIMPRSWVNIVRTEILHAMLIGVVFLSWGYLAFFSNLKLKFGIIDLVFILFVFLHFISISYSINHSLAWANSSSWLFLYTLFKLVQIISFHKVREINWPFICSIFLLSNLAILGYTLSVLLWDNGEWGFTYAELSSIQRYLVGNNNTTAALLVLLSPLYLVIIHKKPKWKFILFPALLFQAFIIILLNSRGATIVLTLVAGLGILYIGNQKRNLSIAMISAFAFGSVLLFIIDDWSTFIRHYNPFLEFSYNQNERLELWRLSMKVWKEHPLFGVGSGNWIIEYPKYAKELKFWFEKQNYYSHPHNYYVHILCEIGLVGFMLFGFILALLFREDNFIEKIGSESSVFSSSFDVYCINSLLYFLWRGIFY